jgi:hypothetical protein
VAVYVAAAGLLWLSLDQLVIPGTILMVVALTEHTFHMSDFFRGFMFLFGGVVGGLVTVVAVECIHELPKEK